MRGERTEFTEEKEGVEEMELAATNSHSLEAWLSTIEVSFWFHMDHVQHDYSVGPCMLSGAHVVMICLAMA